MTAEQPVVTYSVFALADLAGEQYEPLRSAVFERLEAFECARSPHLEEFARSKVKRWEEHGHSRTYVLVSPSEDDGIDVPGFFTLGMTSIDLTKVSKNLRKSLSGSISLDHTGAYSIAELARSDAYSSAELPGVAILDEAKSIIKQSRQLIAGRFVVVDAQRKVFEALYQPNGFREMGLATEPPLDMPDGEFITACMVIKDW